MKSPRSRIAVVLAGMIVVALVCCNLAPRPSGNNLDASTDAVTSDSLDAIADAVASDLEQNDIGKEGPPSELPPLQLGWSGDGKTHSAQVGQAIEITLQTIGPGQFGIPSISSSASAVEFIDVSFPPVQNPGGPTQLFRFKAVQAGSATITIEHTEAHAPFTATINVE